MKQYFNDAINDQPGMGLQPYTGEWGNAQLMHLLRRTMYGFTMDDLNSFKGRSLSECLDILLTPSPEPGPALNYYYYDSDIHYDDPDVPKGHSWVNAPYGSADYNRLRRKFLRAWWVIQMFRQKPNLTEKMTLFWHNFLATEMEKVNDSRFSYRHFVLLRKYALGNYKKLIHEVTIDPNMLVYLDGKSNVKGAPNENYGRELQELFTVGKDLDPHYTEDDVKAAARVLTGWKVKGWQQGEIGSYFDPADHDTGKKVFSSFYNNTVIAGRHGDDGAKETDELIDMIFRHKEVGRYLGRKLYRWFVNSDITPQVEEDVINPLAEVAISSNYEMAPILKALLGSEHFLDPGKFGCQIKSPVEFAIGTMKQMRIEFAADDDPYGLYQVWADICAGMGRVYQNLGDPPIVNGWPAYYEGPLYDKVWLDSYSYPLRSILSYSMCSTKGIFIQQYWVKMNALKFVSQFPDPGDPNRLIADSANFVFPVALGPAKTSSLINTLNNNEGDDNWSKLWKRYIAEGDDATKMEIEARLCNLYQIMLDFDEYQLM